MEIDAPKQEELIWKGVYSEKSVSNRDMQRGYGLVEQVWDAKLLVTYVQLISRLDEGAKAELFKEQVKWSSERESACSADVYAHGSESYLEASASYIKLTKARVGVLEKRLKVALKN